MSKHEIESLLQSLRSAQERSSRRDVIECYNALAEEYRKRGDEESLNNALAYHNMELDVCRELDSVTSAVLALRCLGDCYRDLGEIQEAKPYYHDALALSRQNCKHIADLKREHACSSKAVDLEHSFFSSCKDVSKLVEYYRSLCNLGLTYLNESVKDTEHDRYGESDFHLLYRSIPLLRRSLLCIRVAEKQHRSRRSGFIEEEREADWQRILSEILSFRCDALANLGLAYEDAGDLRHSTQYLFQCVYMKDSFMELPEVYRGKFATTSSRAKHSLGVCYMKMRMNDEAEKYLEEDLRFCEKRRLQSSPNTEQFYQACVAEGQTHLTLGTLHLHIHTTTSYQQAQRHYEAALNLFKSAGDHISKSYVADAKQNLEVLRSTREEMEKLKKRMEEAEVCDDTHQQWESWKSICESIMRFEQYYDEVPFVKYKTSTGILFGSESLEYSDAILLFAEYLYNLFSADEEPTKLRASKELCENSIRIVRSGSDQLRLAAALELYGSVLSAIRDKTNDQLEMDSYLEAASLFSKFLPDQLSAYLTNLENLLITFNRVGLTDRARALKERIDHVRETHEATELEATTITESQRRDDFNEDSLSQPGLTRADSLSSVLSEPLGEEEELFAQEGESQIEKTHHSRYIIEDDDEMDTTVTDEEPVADDALTESILLDQIEATSRNPIKQAKLAFKLGSFYQENTEYTKAIPLFRQVQRLLRAFPSHEDLSHVATRCLSVCLRESGDTDAAVDVLNKDIDLLVYRKSRTAGESEYNDYYESELLRSYEELGNCYISLFDRTKQQSLLRQAAECYNRSVRAARHLHPSSVTGVLVNLATVLEEQHKPSEAERMYKRAIAQWRPPAPDSTEKSLIYSNLARAWYDYARLQIKRGLFSVALEYLNRAFQNDILSEQIDDLVRTSMVIGDVMLEMVGRGVGVDEWESRMEGLINELNRQEKRGTNHEKKEIREANDYLQHLSVVFKRWQKWEYSWKSANAGELCQIIIEAMESPPYPYSVLHSILPSLATTESSISVLVDDARLDVSIPQLREWITVSTVAVFTEEQDFNQAVSLLQKTPRFLTLKPVLPCPSPSSVLSSLKQKIQNRVSFPSEPSPCTADIPMRYDEAKHFQDLLANLYPVVGRDYKSDNDDDDDDVLLRKIRGNREYEKRDDDKMVSMTYLQTVNRGNSRFSRIKKRSNEEFRQQFEEISYQPEKRRVTEVEKPVKRPKIVESLSPIKVPVVKEDIQIETNIIICGNRETYLDVIPAEFASNDGYIRTLLTSHVKKIYGVKVEILRIVVNEKHCTHFENLSKGDVIDLFCSVSPESSIVEAYQEIMKNYDYRTAGLYHIIASIASAGSNPCYSSISSICLARCSLVDGDIYHFLLPLQIPLSTLTKLELNDNQLTDISATMIAIWILQGKCPQLREIRLGGNCWHGRGLSKLFFALKDQVSLELIDISQLRIEDEGIALLTSLMRNFVENIDAVTHTFHGFHFFADYITVSVLARKQLFLSFSQIAFETIHLDGVKIPEDVEFQVVQGIREMKLLHILSLRYCNLNPHVLCTLFTSESLPSIHKVDISGNQKGDVNIRAKLLESATMFVQLREVEIEMKEMDISAVLTDAIACKIHLILSLCCNRSPIICEHGYVRLFPIHKYIICKLLILMKGAFIIGIAILSLVIADKFAIVMQGDFSYSNYSDNSNTCRGYDDLIASGIPAENIIYMANIETFTAPQNPFPNKLFTLPDPEGEGWDHGAGCKDHIDYYGKAINPDVVLAILRQDEAKVKELTGYENPRVLHTTKDDTIFIYYSDHGNYGAVGCGTGLLTSSQLMSALTYLYENNMYSKLVFYLEACESGTMFHSLPDNMRIYAMTSSDETLAWCDHCPPYDVVNHKHIGVCMSMYFDNAYQQLWEEESTTITLGEIRQRTHDIVIEKISNQIVSEWGDLSMNTLPVTDFIGDKKIEVKRTTRSSGEGLVKRSDAPLVEARWRAIRAENNRADAMSQLEEVVKRRAKEEVEAMRLGAAILGEKAAERAAKEESTSFDKNCLQKLSVEIFQNCHHALPYLDVTRNILRAVCSNKVIPEVNWREVCM